MSDLTTEERVYLIECFYSRGKVLEDLELSLDSIQLLVRTL